MKLKTWFAAVVETNRWARSLAAAFIVITGVALTTGCATSGMNSSYSGQGFEQGMPALGAALAPFARRDAPINTDRAGSLQSLQGLGMLMDFLGR